MVVTLYCTEWLSIYVPPDDIYVYIFLLYVIVNVFIVFTVVHYLFIFILLCEFDEYTVHVNVYTCIHIIRLSRLWFRIVYFLCYWYLYVYFLFIRCHFSCPESHFHCYFFHENNQNFLAWKCYIIQFERS